MKKSIIALAIVMVLTMVVALFVPAFAEEEDAPKPVMTVLDWTKADTASPKLGTLGFCWNGVKRGNSEFDAAEGAWKLEVTKEIDAWYACYADKNLSDIAPIDIADYAYVKVCYKTAGFNAGNKVMLRRLGNVWGEVALEMSDGKYTEVVLKTEDFDVQPEKTTVWESVGFTLDGYTADQSLGEPVPVGATLWVKYVAFFETEKEAKNFDITKYEYVPESSAPESSAPESSTPESSAPESSTPESSAPESSKPESSKPSADTGHGTLVGGAVVLFAAAAAVVLASKKR